MTQETEENDYTTFSSAEIEGDREIIVAPKWIGNIRCFWPNKNGIPRITIGPNWGFTIVLGVLVCGTFYITTSGLINMYKRNAAWHWLIIGAFLIISGISSFFLTLLGDPGIPPKVYWYHARPHIEPRLEEKNNKGHDLCRECKVVYMDGIREHCSLCNVCIDSPDHHCVFYSKCIGGGNV